MQQIDFTKERNAFFAVVLCLFFYLILPICIGMFPGAAEYFFEHSWFALLPTPLMVLLLMVYARDCFLKWDDFRDIRIFNIAGLSVVSLIIAALFGVIWMKFLDKIAIPYSKKVEIEEFIVSKNSTELVMAGLMIGIVVPILEEIVFRRVIYEGLRNRLPTVMSVVLASFFFAVLHGIIFQIAGLFVLGLYFQILYLRNKKLGEAIFAHMLNNSFAFVMLVLFGSLR